MEIAFWRWIVDAHKNDGKRYIIQSDELLSAFPELERVFAGPIRLYAGGFKAPACNSLSFLVAARGASAACGGFGFALKTAATFDVFYWLQVTNYGVLYVFFDSAPSGSNYIDVWDLCLHAQTASPIISSQRFSDESRREQAEKLFDRVHKRCMHNRSP